MTAIEHLKAKPMAGGVVAGLLASLCCGGSSMSKLLASAAIAVSVLASSTALAAEKTITLAVKNMYCADCPFIVRKILEAVPGVSKAVVSYKDKTAVVTYDDARTDVTTLTRATTEAGYPSALRS